MAFRSFRYTRDIAVSNLCRKSGGGDHYSTQSAATSHGNQRIRDTRHDIGSICHSTRLVTVVIIFSQNLFDIQGRIGQRFRRGKAIRQGRRSPIASVPIVRRIRRVQNGLQIHKNGFNVSKQKELINKRNLLYHSKGSTRSNRCRVVPPRSWNEEIILPTQ